MKKTLYALWSKFLTAFGNIRISKFPPFFYYDTVVCQINGNDILQIMEVIKPGDVLLRGYSNYLDGFFIPNQSGYLNATKNIGKSWSHGALYIGDNKVIHAVSEGVSEINLIDFCQCDRIAILRPSKGIKNAIKLAISFTQNKIPYDFSFKFDDDYTKPNALYCFELVKACYPNLKISPITVRKLLGLLKKTAYLPQSFIECREMELIYCNNKKYEIEYIKKER